METFSMPYVPLSVVSYDYGGSWPLKHVSQFEIKNLLNFVSTLFSIKRYKYLLVFNFKKLANVSFHNFSYFGYIKYICKWIII